MFQFLYNSLLIALTTGPCFWDLGCGKGLKSHYQSFSLSGVFICSTSSTTEFNRTSYLKGGETGEAEHIFDGHKTDMQVKINALNRSPRPQALLLY